MKINKRKLTGIAMLVLFFGALFTAITIISGWIVAVSVFVITIFMVGFILGAIYLITG